MRKISLSNPLEAVASAQNNAANVDQRLWPGERFPVPYTLHELYAAVDEWCSKHKSRSPVKVHAALVSRFGVCAYHHVKAVWELRKGNEP